MTPMARLYPLWGTLVVFLLYYVAVTRAGVPGLSKHLKVTVPYRPAWRALSKARIPKPFKVDHLCIDMNQIIHSCFRNRRKASDIAQRMYSKLDSVLLQAPPQKSLVLAIDGAAPFAKLQLQRLRRNLEPEVSMISPGTEFMNSLESVLLCYVIQRRKRLSLQDVAVFISDSTCPGEGELKVIDWIRHIMPQRAGISTASQRITEPGTYTEQNMLNNDTIAICGGDSDILIQSLLLAAEYPNVHVLHMEAPGAWCNSSDLLSRIVNTNTVPVNGVKRIGSVKRFLSNSTSLPHSVHSDLMVKLALLGNDYLPRMRGPPILLDTCGKETKKLSFQERHLINHANQTFNFVSLYALMQEANDATAELLACPVPVPDIICMFETALGGGVAANVTWHYSPWSRNATLRAFTTPDTNKTEYLLAPPALKENRTTYYLGEYNTSVECDEGSARDCWSATVSINGHLYTSLKVAESRPIARRQLIEAILQDLRKDVYDAYRSKRSAAQQALEVMQSAVDAETKAAARMALILDNIVPQISPLSGVHSAVGGEGSVVSDIGEGGVSMEGNTGGGVDHTLDDALPAFEFHNQDSILDIGSMSKSAYSRHITDRDVELYLMGILWVEHMYAHGKCSDLSYSYNGRPPVNALAVLKYLEKRALSTWQAAQPTKPGGKKPRYPHSKIQLMRDQQHALQESIKLPVSDARPLSADATALCVTPHSELSVLPLNLRDAWKVVNEGYGETLSNISTSYQEVVDAMEKSLESYRASLNATLLNATLPTDQPPPELRMKPLDVWALGTEPSQRVAANLFGTLDAALMPSVHTMWTVLTDKKAFEGRSYRGKFRHRKIALPLPVNAFSPGKLPYGSVVMHLHNHHSPSNTHHKTPKTHQEHRAPVEKEHKAHTEHTAHTPKPPQFIPDFPLNQPRHPRPPPPGQKYHQAPNRQRPTTPVAPPPASTKVETVVPAPAVPVHPDRLAEEVKRIQERVQELKKAGEAKLPTKPDTGL